MQSKTPARPGDSSLYGKTSPASSQCGTMRSAVCWAELSAASPSICLSGESHGPLQVWLPDRGAVQRGAFSTLNISASPNVASACFLSQALAMDPIPPKYFLSAKAATGILRRAEVRRRNLHPARFAGLRGRHWKAGLEQALTERLAAPEHGGQLALTFEIVYGHAYKPTPRVPVAGESAVSLQDMRAMLRGNQRR